MNTYEAQRQILMSRSVALLMNMQHLQLSDSNKKEWPPDLQHEYFVIMYLHANLRILESLVKKWNPP